MNYILNDRKLNMCQVSLTFNIGTFTFGMDGERCHSVRSYRTLPGPTTPNPAPTTPYPAPLTEIAAYRHIAKHVF